MTRATPPKPRRGFTLIELSIVMLIIGLITAFIAVVGFASAEQARVRATQGLITKLEGAINERLAALVDVSVTPNGAHRYLGSIQMSGAMAGYLPWGIPSEERAYVIAQMDYLKREMPDVFFIQGDITTNYPVNFAGLPYPLNASGDLAYVLPLGNRVGPGYIPTYPPPGSGTYTAAQLNPDGAITGDANPDIGPGAFVGVGPGAFGNPSLINQQQWGGVADAGIYGASYSARAALNQLIGYNPRGTDGADNNSNGYIDEIAEGTTDAQGKSDTQAIASINKFLNNHTHKTARSETLYALLVHGAGPLGSLFRPDDFTDREVQDSDGDGVPEFVDAWGNPLQFYRWPIYYPGGSMTVSVTKSGGYVYEFSGQRGSAAYHYPSELREIFPLDQNKLLISPAWFGAGVGSSPTPSGNALLVMQYFTSFVDPNYSSAKTGSGPPYTMLYDMSGAYARAEFGAKFLVLSAGPDGEYGVNVIGVNTPPGTSLNSRTILGLPGTTVGEDWAAFTNGFPSYSALSSGVLSPPDVASDNITNLQMQTQEGGIK